MLRGGCGVAGCGVPCGSAARWGVMWDIDCLIQDGGCICAFYSSPVLSLSVSALVVTAPPPASPKRGQRKSPPQSPFFFLVFSASMPPETGMRAEMSSRPLVLGWQRVGGAWGAGLSLGSAVLSRLLCVLWGFWVYEDGGHVEVA